MSHFGLRPVALAVAAACAAGPALANPSGPSVTAGSASFRASGGKLTVTNAPGTILNWQSFSIGAGEHTRFRQQSSLSAVLNRVTGADPSSILGRLSSNGRVFLINPNGIAFGQGAVINTAGFVASTLNMTDQDFLAGRMKFEGGGNGALRNEGTLRARGDIFLVGPQIENAGLIHSREGSVLLAAGESVTITSPDAHGVQFALQAPADSAINLGKIEAGNAVGLFAGTLRHSGEIRAGNAVAGADGRVILVAPVVVQTGTISADGVKGGSVAIDATNYLQAAPISASGESGSGGEIIVRARNVIQTVAAAMHADGGREGDGGNISVLASGGQLLSSASLSATGRHGGEIRLLGRDVVLLGASVDASGIAGGGTILVGGDFQGRNAEVPNAARTDINFSTALKADAQNAGNGGKVVVWSDERTRFYGSASARGGAQSGDGGAIEVSAKNDLVFGGAANAGAPRGRAGSLLLDPKNIVIDSAASGGFAAFQLVDPNPGSNEQFAAAITALPNNNVVATDPKDSFTAASAGAVYLFNGTTGALISALTGSSANDRVGDSGNGSFPAVTVLTNGNFVVASSLWSNGGALSAGAVTWASGTSGVSGIVSAANSLVGSTTGDHVGVGAAPAPGLTPRGVTALTNGNYVVASPDWNGLNGAATWGNGATGIVGVVSAANSLVGTAVDRVGNGGVIALPSGNYVVNSPSWNGSAGAATWGNGTTGIAGAVSAANSLVGSTASDNLGGIGIVVLTSGNYVVRSKLWDNGGATDAGAVTWGSGTVGVAGAVSAANSLVGTTTNDKVGDGSVTALTNGNYVVASPSWNNGGATLAGAVTWGNGTTGTTGAVSAANSLVGSTTGDNVGIINGALPGVVALPNGNYVVTSVNWDNPVGPVANVGAVTWGNGVAGTSGTVSAANSLIGSTANDRVGNEGIVVLTNSNYVVRSKGWSNGALANAGAVTWANGAGGTVGAVSPLNSLVGTIAGIAIGGDGVTALTNGNYVVISQFWYDGVAFVGAVTFGNGTTGISGPVTAANSLVGSTSGDNVGAEGVTALTNGNYVVRSRNWDNGAVTNAGAVTFGNGTTGIIGVISAANSLVGTTAFDLVGNGGVTALTNGNYVVTSPNWDNPAGPVADVGAATFGNGTTGISGAVSVANSLVGTTASDRVGGQGVSALANGNYVVKSFNWANGAATTVGAVTFGNGTTGISGAVSPLNSLVGSQTNDKVGEFFSLIANSGYVVVSPAWNNGPTIKAGAVTFGNGTTGVSGVVSAANSVVGTTANDGNGGIGISALPNGNFVATITRADNGALVDAGLAYLVTTSGPSAAGQSFAANPAGNATLTPSAITAITNTGTALTLQASNDIALAPASNIVTSAGGAGGGLTIQAGRSVLLNSSITTDNGNLTIRANEQLASGVVDAQRDPGAAVITMAPGTTVNAGSGTVTIALGDGAGLTNNASGAVTLGAINAGALNVTNSGPSPASDIALGGALTVSGLAALNAAGNLVFSPGSSFAAGSLTAAAGGSISNQGTISVSSGASSSAGVFNNSGAINVNGGTFAFNGGYTQTAGSLVLAGGNVVAPLALSINGGLLNGVGSITGNVNNVSGTVAPGSSPGTLVINGNYTQGAGGTLNLELGGTTQGVNYDLLQVTGVATLSGTLNASLFGGFTGAAGNQFDVITYSSRVGDFSTFNFPAGTTMQAAPNPAFYQLSMTAPPIVVPAVAPPPPAASAAPNAGIVSTLDTTLALPANEARTLNDRFLLAASADRRDDDDNRLVGAFSCR